MPIPSSKWSLHKFYSKHSTIRKHLPATAIFRFVTLKDFLGKYHTIYVKPDREHRGKGIVKVWKNGKIYKLVHEKGQVSHSQTIQDVYRKIRRRSLNQRYIVQQAIPLTKVRGRVFDIRVMMMRNAKGSWQYAGMVSKVAGTNSIVTNVARGKGYVLKVEQALHRTGLFHGQRVNEIQKRLISLSYQIANYFNRYKRSSQIGVDYGVDSKGNIRIIEVNFDFPSHSLFAKLPDKKAYYRIRSLAQAYKASRRKKKQQKSG
ncbi:YheC/YheD family protein [Brevibacillus ginsengisoli]|uniref:YheC/YheD family protein n=1 Tax=Brevibacillus ginsengisoli TaxID=363854 RepID=UPI003CE94093